MNATLSAPTKDEAFASAGGGVRLALPVVFAYLPLGFAAGVVASRAGLSPAEVALLSLLVFAGVSQFIFAEMVAGSAAALISTVFLVNFRHFLYATSLAQKIRHLPLAQRAAVGAQLTDEGFAMMSLLYRARHGFIGLLTFNMSCYVAWLSGNIGGAVAGEVFDVAQWGADFLLIAMFASLLMLKLLTAPHKALALLALVTAALLSISLALWQPHPLNTLIAAALAAALAAVCTRGRADAPSDSATPAAEVQQ